MAEKSTFQQQQPRLSEINSNNQKGGDFGSKRNGVEADSFCSKRDQAGQETLWPQSLTKNRARLPKVRD
jgi:hypothetical protein